VQVDGLAVRLRPRPPLEAVDLGVCLCQSAAGSIFRSYAIVALPVAALALATSELAGWLPPLVLWCAKPWLDRTILFALSRAAFGQRTRPSDVWKAQRQVWWSQWLFTWTVRRLSPWRSLTQPVYQLEGLSIGKARVRVRQIRRGTMGTALMLTNVFSLSEMALTIALLSLLFWLAPRELRPEHSKGWSADAGNAGAGGVGGLRDDGDLSRTFYVAAGFAMYLNRRAELEAWDIEQEFRRAFAS
jgi:hypothetical protein